MLLLYQGLRRRVINHHMAVKTCLLLLEKKLLFTGIRRVCLAVLRGESQGFLVVRVWSFANHVKIIIGGRGALGELMGGCSSGGGARCEVTALVFDEDLPCIAMVARVKHV